MKLGRILPVATGLGLVALLVAPSAARGAQGVAAQGGAGRWSVELEGALRDVASTCDGDGCRTALLVRAGAAVVAGTDGEAAAEAQLPPVDLWVVTVGDAGSDARVVRAGRDLPADTGRLAWCRDGDGPELVLAQTGGDVLLVDPSGAAPVGVVRIGTEHWSAPVAPWRGECARLLQVGAGEAGLVRLAGRGTRRSLLGVERFPLAPTVRRNSAGLTFESPTVRTVDGRDGALAVGPRTPDDLRLESVLFEPTPQALAWLADESADDAGGSGPVSVAWSRLPHPEEVLESRFLERAGRTLLVVATREADKVGLLEKKKLRVFELAPDRTRSGRAPLLEVVTSSRLWQRLDVHVMDVTGDGLDDVVAIQPEGLSGEPLLVDVFQGDASGGFDDHYGRSIVEGEEWWHFGTDWNGDSLPDLLVRVGNVLHLHALHPPAQPPRRFRGQDLWNRSSDESWRLGRPSGADPGQAVTRRSWVGEGILAVSATAGEGEGPVRTFVDLLRPPPR